MARDRTFDDEIGGDEMKQNHGLKTWQKIVAGGTLGLGLLTFSSSFYTVHEREQAVITQFGKPVKVVLNTFNKNDADNNLASITESYAAESIDCTDKVGLHFKIPFIQKVNRVPEQLLDWNGSPEQMPTLDKRYLWVESTAKVFVEDPLKFYRAVSTVPAMHARLDDVIDAAVRNNITKQNLIEIVRTSNRTMEVNEEELKSTIKVDTIGENDGRDSIVEAILTDARDGCKRYGLGIPDKGVLLTSIRYTPAVKKSVENRMKAERLRVAERYKSEGEGEYRKIMGTKDKDVAKISSEAYRQAEEIKGQADGQATKIYADAFNKDPQFYDFMKNLKLYENTMKGKKLVIGTDSDFLELLKKGPQQNK